MGKQKVSTYICVYMYIYVCMCVCIYIYIYNWVLFGNEKKWNIDAHYNEYYCVYIYICTHTHTIGICKWKEMKYWYTLQWGWTSKTLG